MKWVELLVKHPKHGDAGAKLELSETVVKTLVDDGFAKEIEAPSTDIEAQAKAIADTLTKGIESKFNELATELKNEAKSFNTAVTKSFGSLSAAIAKDPNEEKYAGFKSGDHWLMAVKEAGKVGGRVDDRLLKAASGLNTNVGEDGGYLVPHEVSNSIMELVWEQSPFLADTDQHNLTAASITLKANKETSRATGSRRGGVRGYWMSEADQYTASKPKFREMTLKPHKLGVFCYATDEQLSDTVGYNLESKLAQYAAEEISFLVNDAILNGDGVGKPQGILNCPALVSVAKETSQTAATFNLQNGIKMLARLLPRSLTRAKWYVNQDTLPNFMAMVGPTASGTSMVMLAGSGFPSAKDQPVVGSFLGRPIVVTEHNATLGTQGDVLLADMSYYATAIKGALRSAMSMHLRFDYGEVAWRFDFRVDGQSWLDSAITPFKGSNTQSAFVVVDTRA
jgi:HK97 family phage major capsid protein